MKDTLKVLAVGDIVGRPGRDVLKNRLQGIVDLHRIDVVIANGENAAGGRSITPGVARELLGMGISVLTSGNHVWNDSSILSFLDSETALLRPENYPPRVSGRGWNIYNFFGYRVCVINLQGRVYMEPIECPFAAFDRIYEAVKDKTDVIVVDFHAEATSEKRALGWYLDGRASAVYGTHTHIQTSDEEILPGGTGYITDIGMTGAFDSVIGVEKSQSIERFLTQTRTRFEVASGRPGINGIMFEFNQDGKTVAVQRLIA